MFSSQETEGVYLYDELKPPPTRNGEMNPEWPLGGGGARPRAGRDARGLRRSPPGGDRERGKAVQVG